MENYAVKEPEERLGLENYVGQFDDQRILDGIVSDEERQELEKQLLSMYLEKAKLFGIEVVVLTDKDEYAKLKNSEELFDTNKFYLLLDKEKKRVMDMVPITYHLLEKKKARFYAKIMLHDEACPS